MKVLVTGADGFIGRHLIKALLDKGHSVVGTDMRVESVPWYHNFYPWDIRGPGPTFPPLDAVIHLAAIGSPALCDRDPATAFAVNVHGTYNVLTMALAAGAKRFVMASTGHVYGVSPLYFPTDERHPLRLQGTYTSTKIFGEYLCQLFWDNYGLSYAAIRLFNGYGNGQQLGYFVADKIEEAKTGKIVLRGSQVTKDWVFIDDIVRAYQLALESDFVGPINIGTGVETNLEKIARRIADSFGAEFVLDEAAVGGPTRMLCDWGRAQRVLGWRPEVTLEEGLERTIEAWRNHG